MLFLKILRYIFVNRDPKLNSLTYLLPKELFTVDKININFVLVNIIVGRSQ